MLSLSFQEVKEKTRILEKPVLSTQLNHKPKREFLKHLHYFRGIAILNIVIVHIFWAPKDYQSATTQNMYEFKELFFHNSTLYFLFISGFLFYYLSERFKVKKYYRSKINNVIVPYILIGSSLVLYSIIPEILNNNLNTHSFIGKIGNELIHGRGIQVQYWYIPFISIIFAISPLLLKIPKKSFNAILIPFVFLPLLGTRTGTSITLGQYIYFLPCYLLGMLAARNHNFFFYQIKKKQALILLVGAITTVLLHFCFKTNVTYFGVFNLKESLFYVQKMSFCFIIINILYRYKDKDLEVLDYISRCSFGIYFLHNIVDINSVREMFFNYYLSDSTKYILPVTILYTFLVIAFTILLCWIIKQLLGKYSRYFIGA